jgi:hypothetical protein
LGGEAQAIDVLARLLALVSVLFFITWAQWRVAGAWVDVAYTGHHRSQRAKEPKSHMVNNHEESQIERTRHYQWRLIRSITWRDLNIIKKISRKFWSKRIIYFETEGHVLTPFFGKQQIKRDWRKRRTVNTIRRWSEGFNPDSGPVG